MLKWTTSRNSSTKIIIWDIPGKGKQFHKFTFNNSRRPKNIDELRTYTTLRLEMWESSLGIGPLKRLSFTRLPNVRKKYIIHNVTEEYGKYAQRIIFKKGTKWNVSSKITGRRSNIIWLIPHDQTYKNTRELNFPSEEGMTPVKLLL